MKRREDWPERLARFLDARRETAWEYGAHDCALFAADAVHAITGVDPAARIRGYIGRLAAIEVVRQHGGLAHLAETEMARAGSVPAAPGKAQRGDLVLVTVDDETDALGVVADRDVAVANAPGWARVPRHRITAAWHIG